MSFLYRTTPALRSFATQSSPRLFSTAVVYRKTATDTVVDAVKVVDRTVSDIAVKGIDKGVELKEAVAGMSESDAKGAASEIAGEAKGKAAELKGQAKGTAAEMKGKV